jgi:hypothetical protein
VDCSSCLRCVTWAMRDTRASRSSTCCGHMGSTHRMSHGQYSAVQCAACPVAWGTRVCGQGIRIIGFVGRELGL